MIMPLFDPMEVEHPCPHQILVKVIFRRIPAHKEMSDIKTDAQVTEGKSVFQRLFRLKIQRKALS